nr:PREDICTED: uncharacterized protein LOC108220382 [Daucus carota subsp. sativus]
MDPGKEKESEDPLPHSTEAAVPISVNIPEESETIVTTPDIAQEIIIPVEELVAAPDQEILSAANSEEATAPLCSQTLSIAVDDDDTDTTEVTSGHHIAPAILAAEVSAENRVNISVREVSPVRDPSPVHSASTAPVCEIPPSTTTENRVCTLSYSKRMQRAPTSSVEARLSSIEFTQQSMQQTLAELSSSVAQLVKFLIPDDAKKGEKSQSKEKRNDKAGSSTHQPQKTKSQQALIPADCKTKALSEKLVELGDPESKLLRHTVKSQGEEKTFFYKAPTQLAFDEAVAKNLFEEENPGLSLEDIRKEEERLAAEIKKNRESKPNETATDQKKISSDGKKLITEKSTSSRRKGIVISEINYADIDRPRVYQKSDSDSSRKGKKVIDGVPSTRKAELEVQQTLVKIPEETDQNLASDIAQAKSKDEENVKPIEVKATWIKSTTDRAQVDKAKSQKKKSLFGSLGTNLYKESPLLTRIRSHGTRGKEAYDWTGLD